MRRNFQKWVRVLGCGIWLGCGLMVNLAFAEDPDESELSTHQADHGADDADIETLPMVHVHGLRLNKDQQLGPVPQKTPWPTIPPALEGRDLDDWLKAKILVSKTGQLTVVITHPAANRELTLVSLEALQQWTFLPQMAGDDPVDGEIDIRVHFRTK